MGQATNTCIIYDKIQHSSDVLTDVSYSRANLNTKLSFLTDSLEQLSSAHDNVLNASLSCLYEVIQNINGDFDVVEKMSFDLLGVTRAFNDAEGKFDSDKLNKAIQNSDFADDNLKELIKVGGLTTYSSKEGFEKNLTEEELKVLEQYRGKMEKLTESKVVSNFKTVNDFLTFGTTSSFVTAFTATSLLIPAKTPLEFLDGVTGPYSKEGLKGLLMEKYPFLTEEAANKVVEQHTGEKTSQAKEKNATKDPISTKESNSNIPSDNSSNSNVNYRKNTSDNDSYYSSNDNYSSSDDSFSNEYNNSNDTLFDNNENESFDNNDIQGNEQDGNDHSADNNSNEAGKETDIKNDGDEKPQGDNLEQKPSEDTSKETEVLQDPKTPDEEPGSNPNSSTSVETKIPKPTVLSQIGSVLTTSIDGINTDNEGSLDLQTDDLSNISTILPDNKLSAIDDMLTYSPTVSKESINTSSSSIAPVAIGLGLAGTTSVAANKIIKKKEKKQEDIINSFIDKEGSNEERRFIPLDAIGDDDLDNSSEFEKTSQEDVVSSTEKEKTPEEWYDYIKELY